MDESDKTLPDISPARWNWWRDGLIVLVLIAGTIGLYGRTARFDFINYDDPDYVWENPRLKDGLTVHSVVWAFTTTARSNWHPLTWLSYLIDVELFGIRAGPMHIENVLLHTASAVMLFILLLRMTGQSWPSAWVAAMFAWHPLHVESVAWVAERKDVLSTFFLMFCLLAYVRYVYKPTFKSYGWVILLLVLGLMAKPMLVTAPFVMLLLDIWPMRRMSNEALAPPKKLAYSKFGRLVVEKLPMFVIVLASSAITMVVQSAGNSVASLKSTPVSMRIANSLISYAAYLRMTVVPRGLAVFYPHPLYLPGGTVSWSAAALGGAVLAILTIVAFLPVRRMPWLAIGWLWYLGTLVPVIGLVQVGTQALADRYSYFPLIGIFIAVAWTAEFVIGRWARPLGAMLLIATATVCWQQIGYWRDARTVMQHAVEVVPNNYMAHGSLGQAYEDGGDPVAAAVEYHKALEIKPDDSTSLYCLAFQAQKRDDVPEAIDLYRRAIAADSSYPGAYNNYGNLLMRQNRVKEAIEAYQNGIALSGEYPQLYNNLAVALAQQGQSEKAIEMWRRAISVDPNYAEAHFRLALELIKRGQAQAGIEEHRKSVQLQPNRVDMLDSLAWILATYPDPQFHDGALAVQLATHACELTQETDPGSLDALAAAEARAGQFALAVDYAGKAVEFAERQGKGDLAAAIRQRMALYKNRQPYTAGQ